MPQDNAFKKLQSDWYKKLKDSGFDDIEDDQERLKFWSSHYFRAYDIPLLHEAKEDYYRLAGQFLHDHTFKNEVEKRMWELHSQGLGVRDIADLIRTPKLKMNRQKVFLTINELQKEMLGKNNARK